MQQQQQQHQHHQQGYDLYHVVTYLEKYFAGMQGSRGQQQPQDKLPQTLTQLVTYFLVDMYKNNQPWSEVLASRHQGYGDADEYTGAMKRFISVVVKLLLAHTGGAQGAWTRGLLSVMFDPETDPTLYNDKWENPEGKHLPVIQKGEPKFFLVARDAYLAETGTRAIRTGIQRSIGELMKMLFIFLLHDFVVPCF